MIKINIMMFLLFLFIGVAQANSTDATIIMCNDCHGENGISSDADIPSIGGFSETTIFDMLIAYIDETRIARSTKFRHGDIQRPATDMLVITKALSEEQMEEIALYYSLQTFLPAKQVFDVNLAKKGKKLHEDLCTKCHENGGSSADDDTGILAGQWMSFLAQTIKDYRSGERETEEGMKKKLDELSKQQITELINYYASQQ